MDTALKSAAHVVSGTVTCGGQKHFYMEVQNAVAEMVDGGTLDMYASTQVRGGCAWDPACTVRGSIPAPCVLLG